MLKAVKKAWVLYLGLALYACQSTPNGNEKTLEEIPVQSNAAEIIRNPISANEPLDTGKAAIITFAEKTFDFGTAKEGDIVTHDFQFTNTGQTPLLITDARSSCGCTVPEWPEEPIAPGKSAAITVKFDTTEKEGLQIKRILITANTYPSESKIYLRGTVVSKEQSNQ